MRKGYMIKRILVAVCLYAVVLVLNFILPRLMPGDPAQPYYPAGASEELKEEIRWSLGYGGTIFDQFVTYFGNVFQGNFGTSILYGEPVFETIFRHLPWTLVLTFTALVINVIVGTLIGAYCATKRGKTADNVLMGASSITTALPPFWIAMVLVMLFGYTLHWLPTGGRLSAAYDGMPFAVYMIGDLLTHMVLPLIAMCISGIVTYSMNARNAMIAVTSDDYIMTAKAKGLSSKAVLYKHTLRNALLPIVTQVGLGVATLIGGSVVVEQIFNWNGMGMLFLEANNTKDYNLMLAIMMLMSALTLVVNLIVDFLYSVLDPRVKDGQ